MTDGRGESQQRRGRFQRALADVSRLELAVLLSGLIAVALFSLLARAVLREEVALFNRDALLTIHRYATPALDRLAMAITWLGSIEAVALVGAIIGWRLWRSGRRIDLIVLLAVLGGGGLLSLTLKTVFALPRPSVFPPLYHPSGLSFPSGHSLISYCLAGFLAAWLIATDHRSVWRWIGALACVAVATAVALTRLYIGVHWPSDIVAGLLVAVFWLSACFMGRQSLRKRIARRQDGSEERVERV